MNIKDKLGGLIFVLIAVLIVFVAVSCDYHLTKSALTDLSGKEPNHATVVWTMLHRGNIIVRSVK